jgi:NAD(P)-dependent dehydrogenase (short-subunit alcohol dehydrogenase family)
MSDLDGRRIAVAGAGGGLGPAVVAELAGRGAAVLACDRDEDRLEAARAAGATDARTADLLSAEGAVAWASALGDVDGVLHLVGGWRGGTAIADLPDLGDLELLEGLLFHTVVHVTRAFAPALRAAGSRGRFALVSSAQAQAPSAGNSAYAATKAAAEAWTLTFGRELADTGGTANVVVVNALVTPQMREAEPHKAFRTFTDVDDVAAALAYLCSDATGRMTAKRLELHPL